MNTDEDICWYHGKLHREAAEKILTEDGRGDGLFLVRESSSSTGDFVLSVFHNDQVSHFQIRRHTEDAFFSIEENIKFHGLENLIEHYSQKQGALSESLILTEYVKGEQPPHDSRRHGRTNNLLHRATTQGNYQIVSELLKTEYRHEAKNQDGQTAVHLASEQGANDILRKLINYGANVNLRDSSGLTPLHYASRNNFPATVRLLVQTGKANIQARSTENDSVPLHEAATLGHIEVVKELLSLNAPVNPRNKFNKIPSQLARLNDHIECAEILENYKCRTPRTERNEWFHGTLDRKEAETIIRNFSNMSGTYLVRFSERHKEIVLTLLYQDTIFNYIIRKQGGYLFIDNGPYLDSLEHVVEYYSTMPDGLPTVLQNPVPPKPKPPVPEFSTMPRPKNKAIAKTSPQTTKPEEQPTNNNKSCPSQFQNISFTSNFSTLRLNNNNYEENENDYISPDKLKLGNIIGSGEFGKVYEGSYYKDNGEVMRVALKTLNNEQIETNKDAFLREAHVMMKLDHHCIVKLIGLSFSTDLMMVQELYPLGCMLDYIKTYQDSIDPNCEFKNWAGQIACGMHYLEEQKFVHRDLAARNILVESKVHVKISDFGLSRAIGNDHEYRAMTGGKWPLKWYAPESYNFGQFTHKSDVWSFGVTIWEMYSFGDIPYGDLKGVEAIKLIDDGERLEKPDTCPDHIYAIMLKCWNKDSKARPTFSELVDIFSSDSEYMNICKCQT